MTARRQSGARVEDAEGADRAVGRQGQDHQRRRGEDERVVELLFRQHPADEAVEPRARGEQGHDADGQA